MLKLMTYSGEVGETRVLGVHITEPTSPTGLLNNPGINLHFIHQANEKRSIEVEYKATAGDIEVLESEWTGACSLSHGCLSYTPSNNMTPNRRLARG